MRFTLEIPDELFHLAGSAAQGGLTIPGAIGDVMSGGPGPGEGGGGGVAADLGGSTSPALSAGPAEQYDASSEAAGATLQAMDGGAAPATAAR